ncbi:MAG: DUF2087 domain-containing protein [Ancalomicrobiaceae bacterium]|nr:DUF2087 domain-containing protein [Ancalomicrobiaceae bacterium]
MSRTTHDYGVADVSALAKSIKRELEARPDRPGHVEILNILARAAGFRNFQHLKAVRQAEARAAELRPEPVVVDLIRVEAAARCIDRTGVLVRWPAKQSLQELCLWWLWAIFPARTDMDERAVNALIVRHHGFGDYALLRRSLVDLGLLWRTVDGRIYRRIERRPPPEAIELIRRTMAGGRADG